MPRKCAVIAALVLVLSPVAARADWLFSPNIGTTFGGDASGLSYGASIAWMGAGAFGWEADISYTPSFFEDDTDDVFEFAEDSNVMTFMANALFGVPIGGQHSAGFRPYVTGGLGFLQSEVGNEEDLFHVDSNEFGFNLGFGAMGFMTDHVGFRGDLRYFRSFEGDESELSAFDASPGSFNYWRGAVGLTFRW